MTTVAVTADKEAITIIEAVAMAATEADLTEIADQIIFQITRIHR